MSSKQDVLKNYGPLLFLLAAGLALFAQLHYDAWLVTAAPRIRTTFNQYIEPEPLSAKSAKAASFGATEFVADIYWLETIQYYGGGDPYGQFRQLPALYDRITDLSPKFLTAYQNGLLVLPGEGFVNQAITLGEKGQKNLPNAWQIPYYEGLVYHLYKKDYVAAAKEFQIAAADPGAPAITKYFAGIYYNQADQRQTAYQIFQTVYQTTTDPFVKDRAKKYVDHLNGLFALQDAVATFSQRFGHQPASLNDLVSAKIIPAIPVSPLGLQYNYNPQTGAVTDAK